MTQWMPQGLVAMSASLGVVPIGSRIEPDDLTLMHSLIDYGFAVSEIDIGKFSQAPSMDAFSVIMLMADRSSVSDNDWIRQLRESTSGGIVVLADIDTSATRVHALNSGADAYFSRPVDAEILAATLLSLTRRIRMQHKTQPSFRPWRLSSDGWHITSPKSECIRLTHLERCLMRLLVDANGETLEREALLAALAEKSHSLDSPRLDRLIHRLRRKMACLSAETFPLQTVRGSGYCFRAQSTG
ncbi:response regulator transcription factor [Dyella subtropica]|uniref:response regulator transcription factor n=1 Tax=Dyella subtropica TaxID=2992127 RepID=UPI002251E286|nr:response regulator transcription factor [Dyella subtropica]